MRLIPRWLADKIAAERRTNEYRAYIKAYLGVPYPHEEADCPECGRIVCLTCPPRYRGHKMDCGHGY